MSVFEVDRCARVGTIRCSKKKNKNNRALTEEEHVADIVRVKIKAHKGPIICESEIQRI